MVRSVTAMAAVARSGPEGTITLANWLTAPHNRWGVQHAREVVPTARVGRHPDHHHRLPVRRSRIDLDALEFTTPDGTVRRLDAWMTESHADGLLVLHDGAVVHERYFHGLTATRPHLSFSVTKSVTGLLAGVLVGTGDLDPDAPVLQYLPEASGTGWADATVRQVLDMQTSLAYVEAYGDPEGHMARYREAVGWHPPRDPSAPTDLRSFLLSIGRGDAPHGRRFRYLTPNCDLLGWILERAGDAPYAELLTELLWSPMGAECDADVTVDRMGLARAGGGLSATMRDLGRVGELVRLGGVADGRRVVPREWIDDILVGGDPSAWAGSDFDYMLPPGAAYRSQWYLADADGVRYMAAGIHGQWVWGDRHHGVVVVKLASRPLPSMAEVDVAEMACFAAIAAAVNPL